jgi:uncharacterized hydrophobic protein (TIGR00271 family)
MIMKKIIRPLLDLLKNRFNLDEDRADEQLITENIRKEVNFKGASLWALIFAIMIASVGLNVNSTAVIIGAMLISPIMGPIMGIGLGAGINDFRLMRSGFKNLLVAAVISILTSAGYFYITPLHEVNSELLARTNPSLWDVIIAFFGGLAGIVAGTRKHTSNVIPGVAIATALMPPLCTAGFGLATANWIYFLGALYLFFINSLFICLATFIVVKHLRFHLHQFQTPQIEKKVKRSMLIIVILALIPSIYLAYRIVQKEIFLNNAKLFVQTEFQSQRTQVVTKSFRMTGPNKSIEVLLVGEELSANTLDSLERRLPLYRLYNTKLIVHQGLNARQEIDISQIRASILEDVYNKEMEKDTIRVKDTDAGPVMPDLRQELKILYPEIQTYSLTRSVTINQDSIRRDTISLFTAKLKKSLSKENRIRLQSWLRERIKTDSLKLLIE